MAEKKTEKKKDERTRNWTIVVYPESAPDHWTEIVNELHVPWIKSPLHDKDKNPDGKNKKPHWHIVLVFDNVKAYHQIKKISDKLNAPIPQPVASLRGMVRYLIHKDNPEKYQYPKSEIENHGVDDLEKYFQNASSQRQTLREIVEYIQKNHVTQLTDLTKCALDKDDWFDTITNRNTMYLTQLIKSEWQKQRQEEDKKYRERIATDPYPSDYSLDQECVNKIYQMRDKGISVTKIASTLGITRPTVYKYLKNRK